ncbi:Mycocerosic acid synthase [Stieleria neptunia]|uniref:Mycocerosic acid synthase n=1 Tax=Stieleria neptunia TaxID=2527979 RepID=A0A518HIU0_9BACT|nr:type I polyketide synthase [Stieleria neptunia]QDV40774.1 Mycocerosic acid synthase [Stieleria neptunia]
MNVAPNYRSSEIRSADTPLAVIGMACRLPGANDLDEYWSLMIEGRSAIAELPAERLDQRRFYDPNIGQFGKTYSKIGGIVGDRPTPIEPFRLSDHDIENADPSHVDLCQVAGQAIRDAGLDPHATGSTRGGVFVGHQRGSNLIGEMTLGVMATEAMDCLRQTEHVSRLSPREQAALVEEMAARVRRDRPQRHPGGGPFLESSEASRLISRAFGLDGPCLSINAACSSSLVALAAGAHALQLGDIDVAVVGGLSYCKLDALILFSQAQTVSATGSRPFDADADGLVAAEGYVVAVVKTLERALADKDPIRAVIRGIGVSSDGKGKSLWAPRREGQIAAVRRAYSAEVTPSSVQYVEAHATSTPVGDSTEINSLAEAFNESFDRRLDRKIPIGSVKANIGHTLEAAGLAGLVKTVLAMQHRMIPPVINLRQPNPKVDWAAAPFQLPTSAIPWPDPPPGGPRRAGVNAFGIGGLNVHVVLEEHSTATPIRFRFPHDPSAEDRSIAVVGAALLTPGARTVGQFWDLLSTGRDPKIPVPSDRWDVRLNHGDEGQSWVGGFIQDYQYDWRRHRIPPKQVANADPLQFMILDTVAQALEDSGYESKLDHEHTAVIVGNLVGGEASSQLLVGLRLPVLREIIESVLRDKDVPPAQIAETSQRFAEVFFERMPALLDETGGFSNSSLASRITKTYDLMGGAFALDSSDNSSIMAINTARGFLLRGDCKMVIAAGAQRDLGPHAFECLRLSGRLSPSGHVRSLDQHSDGMAPAEGVAVVLLKKLSDAKADGDEILSVIREIGVARHDDQQTAQRLAIGRGLSGAEVTPDQVSAIELSAGGVADEDRDEFAAIAQQYAVNRERPIHLRSLAGQIGHAGGAAGMIALVKSTLSLVNLQSPVGLLPDQPIDTLSDQSWCELPADNQDLPLVDPSGRVFSTLNSYARGMACHVVIERGQPVPSTTSQAAPGKTIRPVPKTDHGYRSWVCEANSLSDLIDGAKQIAAGGSVDAADTSRGTARCGLAIVYRSDDELRKRAGLFVSRHSDPKRAALFESQGIYCVERTRRPMVAFLFPGQGSQYPSMLTDLVQGHPVASAAAARIDSILQSLQFPSYRDLVVDQADRLGTDVWHTQLSLLVADSILMEVVDAMGIKPDRISAHSYGEFPALVAAGAWNFRDAALATFHRCRLITESTQIDGAMLAADLDRGDAQEYCNAFPGEAFVANCNSDRQTVIAGSHGAIENLKTRLIEAGVHAKILDVPRPYHTPLMAPMQPAFRQILAQMEIAPPRTPLLSSVDNRYVAEPDTIRENLVRQLVQPVLYTDQIRRLAGEGVNVLVEIGPSPVLTRLHEQIVGDEVLWIATDHKKRHHQETLTRLDAALRAAGVPTGRSDGMETRLRIAGSAGDVQATATNSEAGLQLLFLEGSPRAMGAAHGHAMAAAIRPMLDRYQEIATGKLGRTLPDLSRAKSMLDTLVDESAIEEVRGMAEAAGVPVEALLEHNLYAYPEIGAGCTQILAGRPSSSTRSGDQPSETQSTETQWLHAANEDMPLGLFLRDSMRRCVQVRRPTDGLPHVLFSAAGHAFGINGVNAAGVVVTSSMLLDRPRRTETHDGLLHSIVIRRVLETAESVDDALDMLRRERTTGGWGMCISDSIGSSPAYVEYDCGTFQSKRLMEHHLVSNHAQLLSPVIDTPKHSLLRQQRLEALWRQKGDEAPSTAMLQRWLRDQYDEGRGREVRFATMNTIRRVDNQVSVLFDVFSARAWTTPGNHATGADANQFFELDLKELIGLQPGGRLRQHAAASPIAEKKPETATDRVISWQAFSQRSTGVDGRSPVDDSGKACNRFALRCIETPPAPQTDVATTFRGGVLVLGDNAAADRLAETLQNAGVRCLHLRQLDDVDVAMSELETFCRTGVPTSLFLLTAWDQNAAEGASNEHWQRRRRSGMLVPYQLCQRWLKLLGEKDLVGEGTIGGGVRLGGMLGFDDHVSSPEGGFTTGLVKGLLIELGFAAQTTFRARVVDFDEDADPRFVAARLIDESASSAGRTAEIAYRGGKRHAVAPVNFPVSELPTVTPDFGRVWVITGGARGVTAKIAKAIGQQFGVKLHLIGSSPLPEIDDGWRDLDPDQRKRLRAEVVRKALEAGEVPIEAWSRVEKALEIDENLRDFADSGLDVTYHACDVSDHHALETLLDQIRQSDGSIDGIVHGAGYEKAASFAKKKLSSVQRTIVAKVDGAISLMELTRQDDLKVFAAFASISGRFGGVGQTDYCLANELLCKLVSWFRKTRPGVHAVAFDWPSWDEVGMAVRPESRLAKTLVDAKYMPVDEGVGHFIDELRRGCPEAEVLITDWERYKRYYTDDYVAAFSPYPMIDRVRGLDDPHDRGITTSHVVDPVNDNFLSQHLLRGRPILPFVAAAEACAEAASLLTDGRVVTTIENFRIAEAMRFFTDHPQEIRVRAERSGDQVRCSLLSDFKNRKGQLLRKDRVHAECIIRSDPPDGSTAETVDFPDVPYIPVHYLDHKLSVYHGPIYRQLEHFYYSQQESWAKIRIADPAEFFSTRRGDRIVLPSVLIDTCVFSAGVHEWTIDRTAIALPHSIGRLRMLATPVVGEPVTAQIVPLESTDKHAIFDINVWDQHGRPVLQIENYRANVLVATIPLDRAQSTD